MQCNMLAATAPRIAGSSRRSELSQMDSKTLGLARGGRPNHHHTKETVSARLVLFRNNWWVRMTERFHKKDW